MSEDKQNNDVERLLRQVHPAQPSADLKDRVLRAVGEAWVEHPSPALWRIAVRRLAVSTAAAVFIIVLANVWSDMTVARSRTHRPVPIAQASDEQLWTDMELDIPYDSAFGRIAAARWPAPGHADTLLDHIQGLQDALSQINIEE